jgi:hypothetical protein
VAPAPTGSQAAQVFVDVLHAGFAPLHWLSEQQFPAMHAFPLAPGQQMSAGLEHAAATVEHAPETHLLVDVSHIVDGP